MIRPTWDDTWLSVARNVARRSLCTREQVGAVIVDRHNRVVATGYNNPPAGFAHDDKPCRNWCERANAVKIWSTPEGGDVVPLDVTHTHEGMVDNQTNELVTDQYLFFTSRGYVETEDVSPCYFDCVSLHAETNAIAVCDRSQREDGTLYVTSHTCWNCAKLIANSGLRRVVTGAVHDASYRTPERSYELLKSCGIEVVNV